jgi:hypothetical protein
MQSQSLSVFVLISRVLIKLRASTCPAPELRNLGLEHYYSYSTSASFRSGSARMGGSDILESGFSRDERYLDPTGSMVRRSRACSPQQTGWLRWTSPRRSAPGQRRPLKIATAPVGMVRTLPASGTMAAFASAALQKQRPSSARRTSASAAHCAPLPA